MDNSAIIIFFLISTITIMVLFILFLMAVILERKNKIRKLKHNLSFFSPEKLIDRLEVYSSHNDIDSEEVVNFEKRVTEIAKIDYKRIQNILNKMNVLSSYRYVLSFVSFRKQYLKIFDEIRKYQDDYLNIRFEIFELTSDIEIKKAILRELSEKTSHVSESVNNSPIERIRNSKKLENKISKIRKSLKELNLLIEKEGSVISSEFISLEEKIVELIKILANDVDFMHGNIKHLDEDLQYVLQGIVSKYQKHSAILEELSKPVHDYVSKIKNLTKAINIDIDEIKVSSATEKMSILDEQINQLYLLIHSNVDYADFNHTYDMVPTTLQEFAKSNHGMFLSEIKRHRLQDEQTRILYIQQAYSDFEDAIKNFTYEKMNSVNAHPPQGIHNLLMTTLNTYQEYIKITKKYVSDISQVNSSTNDVNMKIAKMNTSLLQVEYNISSLDGIHRDYYEKKKEELQRKVIKLREIFQNNTLKIDDIAWKKIDSINTKVNNLVVKSKGAAFEAFFIKETILYLNRFKGNDPKLDLMIESVSESFADEKYTEALRKSKEIIDIYGIK